MYMFANVFFYKTLHYCAENKTNKKSKLGQTKKTNTRLTRHEMTFLDRTKYN